MSQQTIDRLASARDALADSRELVKAEERRRNELVLDGRRDGMSYSQLAAASGLTRARVMQIIGENAGIL